MKKPTPTPAKTHAPEVAALQETVGVLKTRQFRHIQLQGKSFCLYFDPETMIVHLSDSDGNVSRLEWNELKQFAHCRHCGAIGFMNAGRTEFVNAVTCAKCSSKE